VPAEQESLGGQLAVRLYDEAARDAEVRGKHTGRRRRVAGARRPVRMVVAQTVGELRWQGLRCGTVEARSSSTSSSGPEVVPEIIIKWS